MSASRSAGNAGDRLEAMRTVALVVIAALLSLLLSGCAPDVRPQESGGPQRDALQPTHDDGLSPTYVPDAPTRSVVGTGHVLTGTVVSSRDGSPIAGARLELWPEYEGQGHPDEARATLFTDESGRYRFQCDPPGHIHMRITAAGFTGIAQNSYHPGDSTEGRFDIVLRPE